MAIIPNHHGHKVGDRVRFREPNRAAGTCVITEFVNAGLASRAKNNCLVRDEQGTTWWAWTGDLERAA